MRRIAFFLTVLWLAASAPAEKVANTYAVTANGTNAEVTAISGAAASETNYVVLAGVLATMPAGGKATFNVSGHGAGAEARLCDTVSLANASTSVVSAVYFVPAQTAHGVPGGVCLLGTNATFTVQQSAATTNAWSFQLFFDR